MNKRIRRGYDFLARFYDGLAFALFGNRLKKCKEALLAELPEPVAGDALVLGGGTGVFLEALMRSGKAHRIVFVDVSPAMTARARNRTAGMNTDVTLEFHTLPVQSLPAKPAFDLVCTNFFLDSFEGDELKHIMNRVHAMLRPGGRWYFSDFQGGPGPLIALLYAFFRLVCGISARRLPDYPSEFRRLGLVLDRELWSSGKMLRTAIYKKARD